MALDANVVWEIRAEGSDNFGGGFSDLIPGTSVDHSQQDSPEVIDVFIDTIAPDLLKGTFSGVDGSHVGNTVNVSGTRYQIIAIGGGGNYWQLDRAHPFGTQNNNPQNMWMGGALVSPGMAFGLAATHALIMKGWIKEGIYLITSATSNVSGGRLTQVGSNMWLRGYSTNRGDIFPFFENRPILKAAVNSFTIITVNANNFVFSDLILDGDRPTRSGVNASSGVNSGNWFNVSARNMNGSGMSNGNGLMVHCECTNCNGAGLTARTFLRCFAVNNPGVTGLTAGGGPCGMIDCVSAFNGTGIVSSTQTSISGCTVHGNSGDGIDISNTGGYIENTVVTNNGGYGVDDNGISMLTMLNVASFNNTSGRTRTVTPFWDINPIFLGALPYISAATNNFRPDAVANGGLMLRNNGYTEMLQVASNPDIGAYQTMPELPTPGQVRLGIGFGAEGVEYTGTLVLPSPSQVQFGIQYGTDGTELTGTLSLLATGLDYTVGGSNIIYSVNG